MGTKSYSGLWAPHNLLLWKSTLHLQPSPQRYFELSSWSRWRAYSSFYIIEKKKNQTTHHRLLHRSLFTHRRQTCSARLLEIIPREFMIWHRNLKVIQVTKVIHWILIGHLGNTQVWLAQRMVSICMNLKAKVLAGVCMYWWVDDQADIRPLS